MAKLRIYSDIVDESEKFWYEWYGQEATCYKDIETFTASIPKDDDTIDMRIFCNGGNVVEGWAIYDRLRLSGKKITCTIEGKACSMATIIMLAAPKEARHAYENASILVHNPWIPCWGLGSTVGAKELENAAEEMRMWQDKMVDLYVERCGCDRDEIQALMDKDIFISVDRAIELGLVADKLPPISASSSGSKSIINNINKKNPKAMAKENDEKKIEVKGSLLHQILAKLGIKAEGEDGSQVDGGTDGTTAKGMELETSDGEIITVEREEGEPQVGDKASPDGTFEMPDGKTITIKDGEITNIEDGSDDGDNSGDNSGEGSSGDSDTVAQLQEQVNALTVERDELKDKLDKAERNAKTNEDKRILNAIKMAGGAQKVLGSIGSNYQPEQRTPQGKNASKKADAQSNIEANAMAILAKISGVKSDDKK